MVLRGAAHTRRALRSCNKDAAQNCFPDYKRALFFLPAGYWEYIILYQSDMTKLGRKGWCKKKLLLHWTFSVGLYKRRRGSDLAINSKMVDLKLKPFCPSVKLAPRYHARHRLLTPWVCSSVLFFLFFRLILSFGQKRILFSFFSGLAPFAHTSPAFPHPFVHAVAHFLLVL